MPRGKHAQQPKREGTESRYKGVTRIQRGDLIQWRARIVNGGKQVHLDYFPYDEAGEIAAARAYDDAARRLYGQGAQTNF